jgi:hypothetical protein
LNYDLGELTRRLLLVQATRPTKFEYASLAFGEIYQLAAALK